MRLEVQLVQAPPAPHVVHNKDGQGKQTPKFKYLPAVQLKQVVIPAVELQSIQPETMVEQLVHLLRVLLRNI